MTADAGHSLGGLTQQLTAWLLLILYGGVMLILTPRELRFLRDAEPVFRRRFIFLEVVLQVCILLVLLPCALFEQLTKELMLVVLGGFTGLWIVVLTLSYLRYIYTYRMLVMANQEQLKKARATLEGQYEKPVPPNAAGGQDNA